jgi:hypothetical protein
MYKVRHLYKSGHLMDLNLMAAQDYQKRLSSLEIAMTVLPVLIIGAFALASFMPELSFLAQCQNIPGGDVCSITLAQ